MDSWGNSGYGQAGVDATLSNNLVFNIGPSGTTDSLIHGLYMIASGIVANNVLYNVAGCGISNWHGGQSQKVMNNTIDNARDCGIVVGADAGTVDYKGHQLVADYNNVGNNIVTSSGPAISEQGETGEHNSYYNNLLYADSSGINLQNRLEATNTVYADPLYVDRSKHNYHLRTRSPAIDAGSRTNAPSTDFDGNIRPQGAGYDIGAYEFVKRISRKAEGRSMGPGWR